MGNSPSRFLEAALLSVERPLWRISYFILYQSRSSVAAKQVLRVIITYSKRSSFHIFNSVTNYVLNSLRPKCL